MYPMILNYMATLSQAYNSKPMAGSPFATVRTDRHNEPGSGLTHYTVHSTTILLAQEVLLVRNALYFVHIV